jgi:two-component system, NtrC family, response regulator GlrR
MVEAPAVLVVDDDADLCQAISTALSASGYCVLTASSLADGAVVLQSVRVEAIVSDWDLAGEDGTALLHFSAKHQPRVGRVLLTGKSREALAPIVARGVAHVGLSKPFVLDDLIDALALACGLAARSRW